MKSATIILDTNILFSGLYSSKGASFKVLRLIEYGKIKPVISTALLFEYEDVLRRKKEELLLSNNEIDIILDNFCSFSSFQKIYFLWRPYLKDPKDDHVLEVAVASKTNIIITYNLKDFIGANKFGIKVLSPKTLLETLE
jgi:putative PIN family toxin of toxin-antitoxin system